MSFRQSKRRISATLQLDGSSKVQTNRKYSPPSLEPLEGMVVCPIDLNFLDDPRLLPCGHAFCCDCLTSYMNKLPVSKGASSENRVGEETSFACPICRMMCAMPATKSATSFPKAFNHIVILDFLRKNQLADLKTSTTNQVVGSQTDPNGSKSRKTSMQVNSQMLNYIVSDIAARERDGKIGPLDRALIMNEVMSLLEKLNTQDASNSTTNNRYAELQPPESGKRSGCSSSSTNSPNGSFKHLDRFNAFASKARKTRRVSKTMEVLPDTPSYTTYRDAESVRITMKQNAVYTVLNKGKNCCIMRVGESNQPVDVQLIKSADSSHILRQTITTDSDHTKLIMWSQSIESEQKQGLSTKLREISGPIHLQGYGRFKITYVRFFQNCIYMSGTVSGQQTTHSGIYPGWSELESVESNEVGLIVCCSVPTVDLTKEGTDDSSDNQSPFTVLSVSCAFLRDSVGSQRSEYPILFGLDIDKSTGELYVAHPANAMISRLHTADMSRIDGTWYLNDPQLSPYFVCYSECSRQVWATCPHENKVAILDLENDGFHHFNPNDSFGITPSHIIYTTDERIVMLDQKQSRMFWITKVHQTICVQCLDVQFTSSVKRQLLVIQPMDDDHTRALTEAVKVKDIPLGGILCAHDHGCSIVYPARYSEKSRLRGLNCYSVCGS